MITTYTTTVISVEDIEVPKDVKPALTHYLGINPERFIEIGVDYDNIHWTLTKGNVKALMDFLVKHGGVVGESVLVYYYWRH